MMTKLKVKWKRIPPTQCPALRGIRARSIRMKGAMQAHIAALPNCGAAMSTKLTQDIDARWLKYSSSESTRPTNAHPAAATETLRRWFFIGAGVLLPRADPTDQAHTHSFATNRRPGATNP